MKKELQKKQLTLNKETVSELNHMKGGQGAPGDANSWWTITTTVIILTGDNHTAGDCGDKPTICSGKRSCGC